MDPAAWHDELTILLARYPKVGIAECSRLLKDIGAQLDAQGVPADASTVLRLLLSDLLGTPKQEDGYLLAAGWLLDMRPHPRTLELAQRDAPNVETRVEGLEGTLAYHLERNTLSMRRHIAFWCLKDRTEEWGSKTAQQPRTQFGPKDPRTKSVAHALAREIVLNLDDLRRFGGSATDEILEQAVSIDETARIALREAAAIWNEPSRHYPPHLTPTVLAKHLTLSPIPTEPQERVGDTQKSLYSSRSTYGGKPLEAVLSEERRLVVLGNPGGGKSTVLTDAVVTRIDNDEPAIFVRLSNLSSTGQGKRPWNLRRAVKYLVKFGLAETGAPEAAIKAVAEALLDSTNSLIALDGLDELQEEQYDSLRGLLRVLNEFPGEIIVSSRWTGYRPLSESWMQRSVDNLSHENAIRILVAWFGEEDPIALARAQVAIDSQDEHKTPLGETPVLLGIIAIVAKVDRVARTEALLYQQYISLFLEGYWRPPTRRRLFRQRLQMLALAKDAAWKMATGMTGKPDRVRWRDLVTPQEIHSTYHNEPETLDLVLFDGLLVPHGVSSSAEHQPYRWIHRTVHEHLVGAYLLTRFDLDSPYCGLPPELLMGTPHWLQPIRHLSGLLSEEDNREFVAKIVELAQGGDPVATIRDLAVEVALISPPKSAVRSRLAHSGLIRFGADIARLDREAFKSKVIEFLALGDLEQLRSFSPEFRMLEEQPYTEDYVRKLVGVQRSSRAISAEWATASSVWLSQFDPDDALKFLVECRLQESLAYAYQYWRGVPSSPAVRAAVSEIVRWGDNERLNYLHFLTNIGVTLDRYVTPVGPVLPIDASAAQAISESRDGTWWRVPLDELPRQVATAILEGRYGSERAFEQVLRYRGMFQSRISLCDAAKLALDISDLDECDAGVENSTDLEDSIKVIRCLKPDDIFDDIACRRVTAAMKVLLNCAANVSLDFCLEASVRISRCHAVNPTGWYYSNLLSSWKEVLKKMVLLHSPAKVVEMTLKSRPRDWCFDDHFSADFFILSEMSRLGLISVTEIVSLLVWADKERLSLGSQLELGDDAKDIVRAVWSVAPHVLRSNIYGFGRSLVRDGMLWEWRDRLTWASAL